MWLEEGLFGGSPGKVKLNGFQSGRESENVAHFRLAVYSNLSSSVCIILICSS